MAHPPHRPVTLKDIARRCGVTAPTVSRALRDPHRHSKALTARIQAAAKEMGYNPAQQHVARRLSLRRQSKEPLNQVLGVVLPENFHRMTYYVQVYSGILDICTPRRLALLTLRSDCQPGGWNPPSLERGDVDALLGLCRFDGLAEHLRDLPGIGHRPLLSLLEPTPGCPLITADFGQGTREALLRLCERGHRHVAYLHKPGLDTWDGKHGMQVEGLREALRQRNLDPETHLHCVPAERRLWDTGFGSNEFADEAGLASIFDTPDHPLLELLQRDRRITAVFAPNDTVATLTGLLLERHGVRIPHDISLVGCDDISLLPHLRTAWSLSTVRLPLAAIGQAAARVAIDCLPERLPDFSEQRLGVEWIERDSTGPAAPAAP